MDITVLFVATANTPGLFNFIMSLKKYGYTYMRLGAGQQWLGWRYRMKVYIEELERRKSDDIVLLLDADDMMSIRSPDGLLEQFKSFNKNIVVSAQTILPLGYQHVQNYWNLHTDINTPRKYICCGAMMGRVSMLLDVWKALYDSGNTDDQVALGKYINNYPSSDIALDYDNRLFYSVPQLHLNMDVCFENGTFKQNTDGYVCKPFFAHFDGYFIRPGIERILLGRTSVLFYNILTVDILGIEVAMPYFNDSSIGNTVIRYTFWSICGLMILLFIVIIIVIRSLRKKQK